jgi:hypothetical protein
LGIEICHFVKTLWSKAKMVKGTFWTISKKLSHFKEESYGITQIFEEFGQISSFLLLKLPNYLSNNF